MAVKYRPFAVEGEVGFAFIKYPFSTVDKVSTVEVTRYLIPPSMLFDYDIQS